MLEIGEVSGEFCVYENSGPGTPGCLLGRFGVRADAELFVLAKEAMAPVPPIGMTADEYAEVIRPD